MSLTVELCSGPVMWLLLLIATVAGSPVEEDDYKAYAAAGQVTQSCNKCPSLGLRLGLGLG